MATSRNFSSVEELETFLAKEFSKVLKTAVVPVIKEQELKRIQTTVYDRYKDPFYERRKENRGLLDANNIQGRVNITGNYVLLDVANVTKANPYYVVEVEDKKSKNKNAPKQTKTVRKRSKNAGRYLVELVSMGGRSSYDIDASSLYYTKEGKLNKRYKGADYMKPRPFIHATVADLRQSDNVTKAFKQGLKNRGFKIV